MMGEEVITNINKFISSTLPNATEEGMEKVCLFIEGEAKDRCPVGSGTLRASITYQIDSNQDKIVGYVGSNLDYAPFVHQGTGIYALEGNGRKQVPWTYWNDKTGQLEKTVGLKPTPFIQDAIDANRDKIMDYFKGVLE